VLEQDPGERMPPTQRASAAPFAAHATTVVASDASAVDPEWVDAQLSRLDLLLRTLVEPEALAGLLLRELAPMVGAAQGAVYVMVAVNPSQPSRLMLRASYAAGDGLPESVLPGEGLIGQCAVEQRKLVVRDVSDDHFRVRSALGASAPRALAFVPVWLNDSTLAVLELGFTSSLAASRDVLLDRLAERRPPPEQPDTEARGARLSGLVPRPLPSHRSGFWGKLSHELRSPLNSVLVLSQLLSENEEHNLTAKQVAFAKAIHTSGNDLLALINAISDLSKIETNRLVLEPTEMPFDHFEAHIVRAFEPVAKERGLDFAVELAPNLPPSLVTDAKRLRQIMKCLLSNAFKFTESGRVCVQVSPIGSGWSADRERLNNAREVVAFSVIDTGVGMSESEQRSILDVFPPERIESRRGLGASGLGLAISRELARLLGGDLRVSSVVGSGSTFTLYLPTCGLPSRAADELPPESEARPLPALPDVSVHNLPTSGKRHDATASAAASELAGLSVMLVDDDVRSAFALTGLLERQGAAVSHAEDVGEALARLAEGRGPSALLIDAELLMAGPEGSLRSVLESCPEVPIVALTSARRAPNDLAERVPPEVHRLAKPVDPAELLSLLRGVAAQAKSLES